MTAADEPDRAITDLLAGLRVAFVGKLGGVNRREACRLVRQQGGTPVEGLELPLDLGGLGCRRIALR